MKPFFSILYVQTKPSINESISIGLIFSDGENLFFNYSASKLKVIKELLNNDTYRLLKYSLKAIDALGRDEKLQNKELFEQRHDVFSESYISYLSKYSNNLLIYSKPSNIDLEVNESNFRKLFEKFVYQFETQIVDNEERISNVIECKLYPRIEKRVNIKVELTSEKINNLIIPIDIDFIGKNSTAVTGKVFEFNKAHYYLEADLAKYVAMMKALEEYKKGKYFIIGEEPDKKLEIQHKIWNQIIVLKNGMEFVALSEIDQISEYIERNDIKPYFEDIQK